jgi:hypothetical protein
MSPWLFNIFIDGVVREVNSRVMENGVALVSGNDRVAVESDTVCG